MACCCSLFEHTRLAKVQVGGRLDLKKMGVLIDLPTPWQKCKIQQLTESHTPVAVFVEEFNLSILAASFWHIENSHNQHQMMTLTNPAGR